MNDLENALVRMNVRAAMLKAQRQPSDVTTVGALLLRKGDVDGHEFHGNQYSDGGGAASEAYRLSDHAADHPGNATHSAAAAAHLKASEKGKNQSTRAYHNKKYAQHKATANFLSGKDKGSTLKGRIAPDTAEHAQWKAKNK